MEQTLILPLTYHNLFTAPSPTSTLTCGTILSAILIQTSHAHSIIFVLAPHVIPSPLPPQLITYYTLVTKAAPVHGVRPSTLSNELYLV